MPTVIDSLVLELGIDPKKFIGGSKEVQNRLKQLIEDGRKGGVETESHAKRISETLTNLKREALGVTALFLGGMGLKQFAGFITNLDASTGRLSKILNMSAQELSAWEGAVRSVGGVAGEAGSALQGLTMDVQRFLLGAGGGGFAQLLNSLKIKLTKPGGGEKSANDLLLEVAKNLEDKGSPARRAAFLSLFQGMTPGMMNLLIEGEAGVRGRLAEARKTAPSDKDIAEAKKYQEATANLERSASRLSAAVMYLVSGPLVAVLESLTRLIQGWMGTPKTPEQEEETHRNLRRRFGEPPAWLKKLSGETPSTPGGLHAIPRSPLLPAAKGDRLVPAGPASTVAEMESYIKAAATARGIDPGIALAYARSQSGGMATGAASDFEKATGLNASDPSSWKAQVDYVLDRAKSEGGARWSGWRGRRMGGGGIPTGASGAASAAGRGASGAISTSTSEVNIGTVVVQTQATDAEGIARDIVPALRRQGMAAPANTGQE